MMNRSGPMILCSHKGQPARLKSGTRWSWEPKLWDRQRLLLIKLYLRSKALRKLEKPKSQTRLLAYPRIRKSCKSSRKTNKSTSWSIQSKPSNRWSSNCPPKLQPMVPGHPQTCSTVPHFCPSNSLPRLYPTSQGPARSKRSLWRNSQRPHCFISL